MRNLNRNKRKIYYALWLGDGDVPDDDGNLTGEKRTNYSEPVECKYNVSGGRGAAQIEVFGVDNPFTRTVSTGDVTTPFKTSTIWWFDADPATEEHNYRCTGVSRTLNETLIALAEVDYADNN